MHRVVHRNIHINLHMNFDGVDSTKVLCLICGRLFDSVTEPTILPDIHSAFHGSTEEPFSKA